MRRINTKNKNNNQKKYKKINFVTHLLNSCAFFKRKSIKIHTSQLNIPQLNDELLNTLRVLNEETLDVASYIDENIKIMEKGVACSSGSDLLKVINTKITQVNIKSKNKQISFKNREKLFINKINSNNSNKIYNNN